MYVKCQKVGPSSYILFLVYSIFSCIKMEKKHILTLYVKQKKFDILDEKQKCSF